MSCYIGIDLGTSAMKLLLMDSCGDIKNIVSREYPLEFPNPGWSQQNPEDWRRALMEGIPELLDGFDGETVAGTMPNNGAVAKTLDTTTTSYTVAKGYHSGTGKVSIALETKTATPTKAAQDITPTSGKVLSKVTVAAIPDNYIDTTDADAVAGDILDGKFAYVDGEKIEGTMPDNGAVSKTLSGSATSYTVPAGYHDGTGKVSIVTETKSATPTNSAQTITPSTGKVLTSVSVAAIPAAYQDVTGVTAAAADVLDGKFIVLANGTKVEGSMPNNGSVTATMDGLTQTSVTIPAGYTSGGTVSLTDDIENALAAI